MRNDYDVCTLAGYVGDSLVQLGHVSLVEGASHFAGYHTLHYSADAESVHALGDEGIDRAQRWTNIVCSLCPWKVDIFELWARTC